MPAPDAAEAILVGELEETSNTQPLAHWRRGELPDDPLRPEKPAPVLLRDSELAGSVAPPLTYPGPESLAQLAFGQYCANVALWPELASPFAVTFQPELVPVASSIEKVFICAESVWD
jgi:hypothetical protein